MMSLGVAGSIFMSKATSDTASSQAEFVNLRDIATRHRSSVYAARDFVRRSRLVIFRPSQRRILVKLADVIAAERALSEPDPPRLPLAVRSARTEPDPLRLPVAAPSRRVSRTRRRAGG